MSNESTTSNSAERFKKVAKGGVFFSLGTVIATLLQFVTGIMLVRVLTQAEYGLITLGTAAVTILSSFAILGFQVGLPRFISKYHQISGDLQANKVASSALMVSLLLSMFWFVLLRLFSDKLAIAFNKPQFDQVLWIMALMMPAMVLIEMLTAIFRGIENVNAKVWFQDILLNTLRFVFLLIVALAGIGLTGVLWAYLITIWITAVAFLLYFRQRLKGWSLISYDLTSIRELLVFSLPLFGMSVIENLVMWTSTMLVGYLHTAEEAGLWSAPGRLVSLIPIPLTSLIYLYLPVANKLIHDRFDTELFNLYLSTTKWSFLLSAPIVLYFFVDARYIVETLFGPEYQEAASILRVLTVGYAVHTFLGPNGITMAAYGETRLLFYAALLSAFIAAIASFALIPSYGGFGAACSVAIARIVHNIGVSIFLYKKFSIHPFIKEYSVLVISVIGIGGIMGYCVMYWDSHSLFLHILLLFMMVVLTLVIPVISKSFNSSDREVLNGIKRRLLKPITINH